MGKILIVEDMEEVRLSLAKISKTEGHVAFSAPSGEEALDIMKNQLVDLVFLDIGLPDTDGISLISKIREISSDVDIIMLTGKDDAESAMRSLKAGAIDYMLKPFDIDLFRKNIQRVMGGRRALKRTALETVDVTVDTIIGRCKGMRDLKDEIKVASDVKSPVLITGETGTGKELVARAIYGLSGDGREVFVKVDCGTLAGNIIESELFGHRKGAFTDAKTEKKGLVELADGGTLFLDEIGNLPPDLQPKLLRLIEEGTFRKVGGTEDIHVNVRTIAATNRDLEKDTEKGLFRQDLYFRLKVIAIDIPPLRDRGDDILSLMHYYVRHFSAELKKGVKGIVPEAETVCLNYGWPGNVRELRNCIERAVIYCRNGWVRPEHLNIRGTAANSHGKDEEFVSLDEMERRYILKVLASVKNNKTKAAEMLGISRTTLREKIKPDNS